MRNEIKIFLTLFILYFFFVQWYGWNEESNFSLLRAMVEEKRFEIDSFANQTGDRAFYKNHYYTDKEPGLSFISSPFYATWKLIYNFFPENLKAKYAGSLEYVKEIQDSLIFITYVDRGFFTFTSMILVTTFTSCLFSSLTALLIYKISRYFLKSKSSRVCVSLTYGMGTLAFPLALHFMTHAVSTFFLFLSFYILFKIKNENLINNKYLLLAGVAAGFSMVTDRLGILLSIILFIYTFSFKKKFLFFLLASFLSILPLSLYNYSIFGNPFELASSHIDRQIYKTAYSQSLFLSPILESYEKNFFQMGFLNFDMIKKLLEHFHLIPTFPNPYVIFRLLFCPYRGLFFYSPVLLLSIPGFFFMFKKYKLETILIVIGLFLLLSIIAMRRNWWGGYGFGNRYLLPITPFLTLPLIFTFKRMSKRVFFTLFFLSIFINFLGLQPAEDWAYDWDIMDMRQDWLIKQNSFQILANPLLDHYLPLTIKYGPRSGIFEHLVNCYISVDIRFPPLSKGTDFPFSRFHIPFLVLFPIFLIEFLIWRREIRKVVEHGKK